MSGCGQKRQEVQMERRTKLLIAGVAAVALGGGTAVGVSATGGDNDVPITGDALEKASAAALEATGEGRVSDTETGDEEGYYEVEVTLDDGSQVDVHLDEDYNLLSTEGDRDDVEDEPDGDGD
jgi:uncharacterized membrane protein YkoI